MTSEDAWAGLGRASLLLAGLAIAVPVFGQTVAETGAAAFTPEGRGTNVVVSPIGRWTRYRGEAASRLVLRGVLRMPPDGSADPKIQGLTIHFRTSPNGPSLRAVELRNGSTVAFRKEMVLKGDYVTRETITPESAANSWVLPDKSVSAQSVVRLEIEFPTGFDSKIDPGEFLLVGVSARFLRKLGNSTSANTGVPGGGAVLLPPSAPVVVPPPPNAPVVGRPPANAVIYALNLSDELWWYGHTGRETGQFSWAAPAGLKIGTGWGFTRIFPGSDGVVYAITQDGDLLWYRHDGRASGAFQWAGPQKVGEGWSTDRVFYAGGGVIYSLTAAGDLLWYRHDGYRDGSDRWAAPAGKKLASGWTWPHVFSGGDGVIYTVAENGDLWWYRHDGRSDGSARWTEGRKIATGWDFTNVFSSGDGVIYAITKNDDLLWFRHEGRSDGTPRWAAPAGKKVGSGWGFPNVFSGATLNP